MRKNVATQRYGFVFVISIVFGLMAASVSGAHAGNLNPRVFPPLAKPYGMTYGEWSGAFWKWVVSLPVFETAPGDPTIVHPFGDTSHDCSNGAKGQYGPVWFLAGTFDSEQPVVRDCVVPLGKSLFVPVIGFIEANVIPLNEPEEVLRERVAYQLNVLTVATAEIDGVSVSNLMQEYHFPSPLFTAGPFPILNWFGTVVGSTADAVADGYYLMLAPLSKGLHTVHFTASFDPGAGATYTYDVTYNLFVGGW